MVSERYIWGLLPPESQVIGQWSLLEQNLLQKFLPIHLLGSLSLDPSPRSWEEVADGVTDEAARLHLDGRYYDGTSVSKHYRGTFLRDFHLGETQPQNDPPWTPFENELLLERMSSHMPCGRSSYHVGTWEKVAKSLEWAADFYHFNFRVYTESSVRYHYYTDLYLGLKCATEVIDDS
jgi:hypothetical protein